MMYGVNPFQYAVGKTLLGVAVSDDGESTVRLDFPAAHSLYVTTEGDCCSQSWWADITGAEAAYGSTVLEVQELELPDDQEDGRSRQEYDRLYGYELRTDVGVVSLVFRNSSNGYYGGWATQSINNPVPDSAWVSVRTNDWRA